MPVGDFNWRYFDQLVPIVAFDDGQTESSYLVPVGDFNWRFFDQPVPIAAFNDGERRNEMHHKGRLQRCATLDGFNGKEYDTSVDAVSKMLQFERRTTSDNFEKTPLRERCATLNGLGKAPLREVRHFGGLGENSTSKGAPLQTAWGKLHFGRCAKSDNLEKLHFR
ncbi:hypothetical protein JCGZ_00530 [Jatropha curcas]|uniref:Uncharacterized protein n=1 Tax=Jatropha curcas TaxID=180498 RepID=A0A067JH06_JATCU|nr:hypothetical protein JCGZ_00530 [Jatropha curcas]